MASTPSPRGSSGAAQDRMVGRVLGDRYRVLSRLGEGGMGTVYLCQHAVLGRRYAVKVLRPGLSDPELAERFRNEAIAASRIGGDNVVDVLDFGAEEDGALYYVMEALEGRSLGALIAEEGPLEVDRALALLEQLCRALAGAHARGVVHRDVKPDNVFVVLRPDGSEQVKVIDFGISQVAPEDGRERITRAGAIIGTPEYMAPEQAAGDPVDHRADVYALGVLAYELLTGTLPIVALTPVATLVAHQTRTPEAPSRRRSTVPPEVDALVLRALAKRPEDRPPTMEAFAAQIALIRGVPGVPSVSPATPARTLVRPRETVALGEEELNPRRNGRRRALAAGVGVAVAIAAGMMWWAVKGGGKPAASPTATTASTATPTATATPTPTATAAPTATATATPAAFAPPGSGSGSSAASTSTSTSTSTTTTTTTTAPAPSSARRSDERKSRGARAAPPSDAHLQDPYGTGALKDPYR